MFISEATWNYVHQHQNDDVRRLALQGAKAPEVDLTMALQQVAGRQTARRKLPTWAAVEGIVYPPHLNMEQCSSEQTARYKARLAGEGERFVDLTGGFGVDFYFMSQGFRQRVYVEQSAELCAIAEENFGKLGHEGAVCCCDTATYLTEMQHADVLYLDPARRNEHGVRTYGIEDCSPNVLELLPLLMEKADTVILKLSPMLDWHQAVEALKYVREVHIVSVDNECKELLLVLTTEAKEGLRLVCVNGEQTFEVIFTESPRYSYREAPAYSRRASGVLMERTLFLYEPNASIMKAGCFDELAQRYGVSQLAHDSHLFVSSHESDDFPGRSFLVLAVSSLNKKELSACLRDGGNRPILPSATSQ